MRTYKKGWWKTVNKAPILDGLERIFWTAIQAFFGSLLASPVFNSLGLGWQDSLKIAAGVTAVAVIKVILAIAATRNNTPQLGVETYDSKPDSQVVGAPTL